MEIFLSLSDKCKNSPLYFNDAIEFVSLWLGELADRHYEKASRIQLAVICQRCGLQCSRTGRKRLITTWGGWQEDYAARFWSGLIKDYYIPRLEIHFSEKADMMEKWKEEWINTPYHSNTKPFDSPLEVAKELIANEK